MSDTTNIDKYKDKSRYITYCIELVLTVPEEPTYLRSKFLVQPTLF